jgi:hypothetical protein
MSQVVERFKVDAAQFIEFRQRREHLARHRPRNVPDLVADDGPERASPGSLNGGRSTMAENWQRSRGIMGLVIAACVFVSSNPGRRRALLSAITATSNVPG